mmetsp:Transcript_13480/g.25925  ORF Transcript_13480/g.25925 Transcript_13480/m.25925 type:complete len:390 (+) Transcript_13480:69-1238(+)
MHALGITGAGVACSIHSSESHGISARRIGCSSGKSIHTRVRGSRLARLVVSATAPKDSSKRSVVESFTLLDEKLREAMDEQEKSSVAESDALNLVRELQTSGSLPGFGNGRKVPKQQYSLADLRLNKIEPEALLSPKDTTLEGVRQACNVALAAGFAASVFAFHADGLTLLRDVVALGAAKVVDQVVNGGGGEALLLDTIGRAISPDYAQRVAKHEAGHFLVAYLLGVLPKGYTLSSLDALRKYGALNVQAGTVFCDARFQQEVATGKITSSYVDCFSCIALAGVAEEYLLYGQAEGGVSDVAQLDKLMRALNFSQKKADSQVRWAVLNTVAMLRQHTAAHDALVNVMLRGGTVAECLQVIESHLDASFLVPSGEIDTTQSGVNSAIDD